MSDESLISLAEKLRDRQRAFLQQVREGCIPKVSEFEIQAEDFEELVTRLRRLDGRINFEAAAVRHGISNLLMAVQTAHDYLGREADPAGLERLRDRLATTASRLQRAQVDILAILSKLLWESSDAPDPTDHPVQ